MAKLATPFKASSFNDELATRGLARTLASIVEDIAGLSNPLVWHRDFDDFDRYAAGDWVITTTEGGSGSAAEALIDGAGGLLQITNDDADDDHDFFQRAKESFKFVAGKRTIFAARWKTSDADASDVIFGLVVTDTTPLAHVDGVAIQVTDGSTDLEFNVTKDSTTTQDTLSGVLADDTWIETVFFYNGVDKVEFWVDGVWRATLAVTDLPDDEELALTFGIQNGAAAAKVLTVDYVGAWQER